MKYKSIVFVTPEPIKNMGNFSEYLKENTEDLITFHFPHGYSDKKSYFEKYKRGKLEFKVEFPVLKLKINILRLILYWTYLQYILIRYAKRGGFVIVEKPFFLILNTLISKIKNLKFVYWIGDYYPDSSGFMKVYNYLSNYYNKNLKYVIYESPPVEREYRKKVNKEETRGKYRKLITLGMKDENIKRKKPGLRIRLGFMGVIREMQGLDLIFKFLSETKEKNISLEIIGSGYKLDHYKSLAKKNKLGKKVKFLGFVDDIKPVVKNWNLGLALYENRKDNVSIYCEPTKIKDYLEFGLPVITTSTTYFHKELSEKMAGVIVDEDIKSVEGAIIKIKKDYEKYLLGVDMIVKKYNYEDWYSKRFSFLE